MSESNTPSLLPERDYEAIESAVMETERGRWFLAEYTRRNRSADTEMLLTAIKRLERALGDRGAEPAQAPRGDLASDQLRFDLMEMAATIAQTKLDIAAIAPRSGQDGHISTVASELDSIVTATETATYEILQGAEGVQEIAWSMRQSGIDAYLSKELEARATEIFSACEFQDLTGQRIVKVVQVLNYIEERLNSMIDIWGDETLIAQAAMSPDLSIADSPLQPGMAISQFDVDELMWTDSRPSNAFEGAAVRLGRLNFHIDADAEVEFSDPDPAAEPPAPRRNPLDADAESVLAADADEPVSATRKALVELSQDARTVLFS